MSDMAANLALSMESIIQAAADNKPDKAAEMFGPPIVDASLGENERPEINQLYFAGRYFMPWPNDKFIRFRSWCKLSTTVEHHFRRWLSCSGNRFPN